MKTNAVRQLEKLGIGYELREYSVDPEDLSAIKVAGQIGMPPAQVFKTLVGQGDLTGVVLAVIPGDAELDLKALARVSGNRQMDLAPVNRLQSLTGYIRGGVTALACKKPYPVFVDESALNWPQVAVSAGTRGAQIILSPADYVRAVAATIGRLTRAI